MSIETYHHGSHLPESDAFSAFVRGLVVAGLLFAIACVIGIAAFI